MPINLSNKLGESTYDGLITDVTPAPIVRGGTIRKLGTAATLKRGTVLAKSSGTAGDGKLVILGTSAESNETLTPDCILCDDVDVGTAEDVTVPVYFAGCFDPNKVIPPALVTSGAGLSLVDVVQVVLLAEVLPALELFGAHGLGLVRRNQIGGPEDLHVHADPRRVGRGNDLCGPPLPGAGDFDVLE